MKRQHELFCEAYLATFSWKKAYLEVFPDVNPNHASQKGYDLYQKNKGVQEYIEQRYEEVLGAKRIRADKYLMRLDAIALGEVGAEEDIRLQLDAMKLLLAQLNRQEDKLQGTQEQVIKIGFVEED